MQVPTRVYYVFTIGTRQNRKMNLHNMYLLRIRKLIDSSVQPRENSKKAITGDNVRSTIKHDNLKKIGSLCIHMYYIRMYPK